MKNGTSIFPPRRRPSRRHSRRGFTLIEACLATVIVGVGVMGTIGLFATCSQQNRQAAEMSVAVMLASNIQEAMGGLTFADPGLGHTYFGPEPGEVLATWDDVDDFDGANLSPPIDALRKSLPQLSQYSQVVSVWPTDPQKLSRNSNESNPEISKGTYTGAVRIRVRILFRATPDSVPEEVYQASWIRMDG
ncbi:MAG TPA: hypothetical protein VH518_08810 [Tepidisphaeraceae bacterium]|jgi:type II secretory pathway pseudopilin PulG